MFVSMSGEGNYVVYVGTNQTMDIFDIRCMLSF